MLASPPALLADFATVSERSSPPASRANLSLHRLRVALVAATVASTVVLCSVYIFFSIYTGFSEYDDEGGILIVLRDLLSGHVLYDQVPAMYGPVGLLGKWLVLRCLHLPATHDVVRAITGVLWLLTAIFCGVAAWRWMRQVAAFVLTTSGVCLVLQPVVHEPGHPQDVCGLLLAGAVLLATGIGSRRQWPALLGIGIVGGLLAMTKINLGVFFAVAWFGALLLGGNRLWWIRTLCIVLLLVTPPLLMRQHLEQLAVLQLLVELELSLAACLLTIQATDVGFALRRWQMWSAVLALPLVAIGVCGLTWCLGSSVHGLIDGVIRQPLRVSNLFFRWPPLHRAPLLIDAVSLLLAIVFMKFGDRPSMRMAYAALRMLVGVATLNLLLEGRASLLIEVAPAFCWTVLLPGAADERGSSTFRTFLALLATFQTLWIYPVAGTQVAFALLLPVVVLSVGFIEGVQTFLGVVSPAVRRRGGAAISAMLVLICLSVDVRCVRGAAGRYGHRVSLDLPGARLVRVDAAQRNRLHLIVANLRDNGDLLLNFPGMNSLHLWTGLPAPTLCNPTSWLYLTPAQAAEASRVLSANRRSCVLWDSTQARFWTGDSPAALDAPLVRLLRATFKPAVTHGTWTLLVPRCRQMAVCVSEQGVRREVLLDQPAGFALDVDHPADFVRAPAPWGPDRLPVR